MSGYLSPEDEDVQQLFFPGSVTSAGPSASQQQAWTTSAYQQMPSQSLTQTFPGPSQYVSWPTSGYPDMAPLSYGQNHYAQASTSLSPTSTSVQESWSNDPWPALHPDDAETSNETSRSSSPSSADPRNFGMLLSDGRSWRCAYDGCTSQARFTRPCDLRKHYRRHTKSIYCRHDDCPQSRVGGFSSNKDRQRHEQSHAPAIPCSFKGCERVFSRVDNMKDHVRRIHRKS